MVDSEDRKNAGGEGPGERSDRYPPWLWPLVISLIGGIFLVINGWLTYMASSNKAWMESRADAIADQLKESDEFMAIQMQDLKKRLDRVDDRVVFLEQNRRTSTDADRGTDIALTVHDGEPH